MDDLAPRFADYPTPGTGRHGPFRYHAERLRVVPIVQVLNEVQMGAGIGKVEKVQ